MQLRELIKDYLDQAIMMQLATSVDDQPWVCNLWFGFDDDFNIYWISTEARNHSQHIEKNSKVAGSIVLPQTPKDAPRGVQFRGTARKLTDEADVEKGMAVYAERIFPKQKVIDLMKSETHPHKFYKITPELFVLFDAVNFPDQSRQELRID